ncbi:MAG: diaminopimelate epimerase [Bacteroidales bacterium]|nr:diaminopimelate epimerase [Bacteroidales bacterium]
MKLFFSKYEGTGNDFIVIDNRTGFFTKDEKVIRFLCDRKFGIGADGLILLSGEKGFDFRMTYFNADGKEGSMCGNGGRCITAFAYSLGITGKQAIFIAYDGEHTARVLEENGNVCLIEIKMNDVSNIEINQKFILLDTGSPHYIMFVDDIESMDVNSEGSKIRYSPEFKEKGTNVNFVKRSKNNLFVRTYERGVENETLSCGTGIIASALAASISGDKSINQHLVSTRGGDLKVQFKRNTNLSFSDIKLTGPATFVYKGEILINIRD